ncbi:hypothetical protein TKK_0009661 [Trichogramma kaykai]
MLGSYLGLFYSVSDKPLEYWSKEKSKTGSIKRILDEELNENVLEIQDVEETNRQKTWITCPPNTNQLLALPLPVVVLVVKTTLPHFSFFLQLVDKDRTKHVMHFTTVEEKKTLYKAIPKIHVHLEPGWNRLEVDFNHLSKIFQVQFIAITRLKICANCRIRRIYLTDKHYNEDDMPHELYQGFLDNYMLKWGIKGIERATQTRKISSKNACRKDHILSPACGYSRLFLKNLQAKSDKVLDDFFSKQPVKSVKNYLNFKQRAKLRPYAIPEAMKHTIKLAEDADSTYLDLQEIKESIINQSYLYGKLAYEEKRIVYNNPSLKPKAAEKEGSHSWEFKCPNFRYPEVKGKKAKVNDTPKTPPYTNRFKSPF